MNFGKLYSGALSSKQNLVRFYYFDEASQTVSLENAAVIYNDVLIYLAHVVYREWLLERII